MNACKNATNNSINMMKIESNNDIPVEATGPNEDFKMIIKAIKLINTK